MIPLMTVVRETIIKAIRQATRLLNRLVIGSVDSNRASILISRDRNNDPSLSDPSLAFRTCDQVAPTIRRQSVGRGIFRAAATSARMLPRTRNTGEGSFPLSRINGSLIAAPSIHPSTHPSICPCPSGGLCSHPSPVVASRVLDDSDDRDRGRNGGVIGVNPARSVYRGSGGSRYHIRGGARGHRKLHVSGVVTPRDSSQIGPSEAGRKRAIKGNNSRGGHIVPRASARHPVGRRSGSGSGSELCDPGGNERAK